MARVTYGSEVTEFTGSIKGVTFQRNYSCTIARGRPNKTTNPSNLLSTKQVYFAFLVSQWQILPEANKTLWNAYASAHDHVDPWGNIRRISGYQWFLSCAENLRLAGGGYNTLPPTMDPPAPPPSYSLIISSTDILIQFSENYSPPDCYVVIYASPPIRSSSSKSRRAVFVIAQLYSFDASSVSILTEYVGKFGIPLASLIDNQYFSIVTRICAISTITGLRSAYALNVYGLSPSWYRFFEDNIYPAAFPVGVEIIWGDGIEEAFLNFGSDAYEHHYADGGSHHVVCNMTWSGGGNSFEDDYVGSDGTIALYFDDTPP